MPAPRAFDIYEGAAGYVAVTNEVRLKILRTLAKGERDLPHLMRITGKAKPTLSNVHMRELLAQDLVVQVPHPTDARRKLYRLKGRRIGSSSVPVDDLRGAVRQYAASALDAKGYSLATVLDVLLASPATGGSLRRQAARLGELSAGLIAAQTPREILFAAVSHFEREGVARAARIDFEDLAVELEPDARYGEGREAVRAIGDALAGFLGGLGARRERPFEVAFHVSAGRRVRLTLTP